MTKSKNKSAAKKIAVGNSRESARSEAMFYSIGTGALMTDESGKIEKINDRALEMLGYKREELIGKWFPQIIVALDENKKEIKPIDRPITQSFVSGKPINTRMYYYRKDKSLLPVNITVSPIIVNGKPEGAIEVFEDVSLELEVDKMKSEFISIASHQLRTPLTAVSVYTQMLADGYEGDISPGQKENLEIIMNSVRRMNRLISALLDISKLETGKINVNQSQVDLKEVLGTSMQDLEQDAINKELEINYDLPDKPLKVNSDALLVGEIYSNLISNAIKYTPPQGKLDIKLREKRGRCVFCIKDNGYGIPFSFKDKIFQKFSRAPNAESVDTSGSGLGLYMAKEIAAILGGRLWFKSTEGKGTCFYFSLPSPVNAGQALDTGAGNFFGGKINSGG